MPGPKTAAQRPICPQYGGKRKKRRGDATPEIRAAYARINTKPSRRKHESRKDYRKRLTAHRRGAREALAKALGGYQ